MKRNVSLTLTTYYASALPGDPSDSCKNYHMVVIAWDPVRTFPKR
ncbi:MAG: hypothetical protein WCV00_10800 [Verrucomicrobiia bacterium]|jgi:hypothetical protein